MEYIELFKLVMDGWSSGRSAYTNTGYKMQSLRDTFATVKDRLKDAEEDNDWNESRRCLYRLKPIFWEIDNVIDEYETDGLLQEVSSTRKRKWSINSETWLSTKYQWKLNWRIDGKINQLEERWTQIQKELTEFNQRRTEIQNDNRELNQRWTEIQTDEREPRQSGIAQPFWPDMENPLGREDERDEYVRLLVSDLGQGQGQGQDMHPLIPVVPIYGTAGIGKTTLAKMIYMDQSIRLYFKVMHWVSLTSRCKEKEAVKKIYESLTGTQYGLEDNLLLYRLKEYLRRQKDDKFLLVIDNIWAKDDNIWGNLLCTLHEGGKGSKILITTRNKNTCQTMRAVPRSILTGLQPNKCWQLIKSRSFPQGINDRDAQQFEHIGMNIAERCQGSPMAAKRFGVLLHEKTEEDWQNKLSEMRVLKEDENEDENGVLARLMVSYYDLPYYEKKCFAYCCMFPNGYEFERNQLIRRWGAEGLIQPSMSRQPEEVGGEYFDNLVERSFFENIGGQVERYRMPILMCNLAKTISEFELRDLKSDCEPPVYEADKARYVSLSHQKGAPSVEIDRISPYTKLRAFKLFPVCGDHVVPLRHIEAHFFDKFTHIRILDLSDSNLIDLPKCIGGLMHLRCLGLSNTKISIIPEELCNLVNLETIELKRCPQLRRLPEGMDKLIKLRHLDLHLEWEEITDSMEVVMPQGIGRLRQLQTLSRFNVTTSTNGQCCNIIALKDLKLKGDLCILNLERMPVSETEEAPNTANLQGKSIEKLLLRWDDFARFDHEQQEDSKRVITYLEPCKSLKSIWLINYPSRSFPTWMGNRSFSKLNTIRISNYHNLGFLKLLGELPELRDLKIDNNQSDIGEFVGFESLELLTLLDFPLITRLSLKTDLPKLRTAHVTNCPNLEDLNFHQNLHGKFEIKNCSLIEQN